MTWTTDLPLTDAQCQPYHGSSPLLIWPIRKLWFGFSLFISWVYKCCLLRSFLVAKYLQRSKKTLTFLHGEIVGRLSLFCWASPQHPLHFSLWIFAIRCLWIRHMRLPCSLWVKINRVQKLTTVMGQGQLQVNVTPTTTSVCDGPGDFLNDKAVPREQSCLELSKTWRRGKEWGSCREKRCQKSLWPHEFFQQTTNQSGLATLNPQINYLYCIQFTSMIHKWIILSPK